MITNDSIGRNIRRLRKERNMTQLHLAKILHLHRATLCSYEIGKRLPDIFILISIADAFEVSLDILVDRNAFITNPSAQVPENYIPNPERRNLKYF